MSFDLSVQILKGIVNGSDQIGLLFFLIGQILHNFFVFLVCLQKYILSNINEF
jgi:hypothetical protein